MVRVLLVTAFACSSSDDSVARCRALGDGTLSSPTVFVGSSLHGDTIEAGTVPTCEQAPPATKTYVAAAAALQAIPAPLRPDKVVIHHAPALPVGAKPIEELELHRPTGALLAAVAGISRAVWLHELAHVRMVGARPASTVAARLVAAIEEGVADYYAATILRSPELGARSLAHPPRITTDDWSALAQPTFDPHRLGWALAASLWKTGANEVLVEQLADCMARAAFDPTQTRASLALAAWLDTCPPPVRAHVCGWLPRELGCTR